MTRSLLSVALVAALLALPALPVLAGEGGGDRVAAAQEERAGDRRDGDGHPGSSPSDPDAGSNGGADKPGGSGGHDDDRDGNNGCGNDNDFEDDNNGNCGGPGRGLPADDETPSVPTQGTAEQVPPPPHDSTRADTSLPVESSGPHRVLRLLAATNAPDRHLAGDRTTLEALFQGAVAFLEQRQLSLRIPVQPHAGDPTPGDDAGPGVPSHGGQSGLDVLAGVLTGERARTDGTMATAGAAEQETIASDVLRTAVGALLLLTSLAIATLGASSLVVGRSRP